MYPDGDGRVPLHLVPYVKEEAQAYSSREFRTKNELAVDLVDKALKHVRPRVVVFDSWHGSQDMMKHISSRELKFVTESKSNRLLDDNDRKQVREYLADHQNEFVEVGYRHRVPLRSRD